MTASASVSRVVEVRAGATVGGEVQQHVRRLVGERGEFDVRRPGRAAGDAATVGVTEQAGCERLVLELDVVADEEGFQRLEVAVGACVGGCCRDCRCVGARDRVHLGDVEDVGDAVAEAGCGVGVGVGCRCRACWRRSSARRSRCRARPCAPGSRPCSRRGSPCTQVASGRCAKISIWLASEYFAKRLMHGQQRQERLAGLGEALLERGEEVVDRAAGFGVHLGGSLSESGPHGPFARRSGDRGRPTREPATPTPDGARNAARAGRVTAEPVPGRGGWRGFCGAGRPKDQREAGAKVNGEARSSTSCKPGLTT